jgi:NAD(P)-dependent dehydrogenase (short-subunit alcohol dehydrogenase family)
MMPPIRTRFTGDTTASQVVAGIDLTGMRAIVTGGASGIGVETVRALAGAGAEVTLAVSDTTAGAHAAAAIDGSTRVLALDLADPSSVAAFTAAWTGPLHLLIANAGVMRLPDLRRSSAGVELQLATNHLGHFQLALGLQQALVAGAAARGEARIVALSSRAHLEGGVDFDDINFEKRPYDPMSAYAQPPV